MELYHSIDAFPYCTRWMALICQSEGASKNENFNSVPAFYQPLAGIPYQIEVTVCEAHLNDPRMSDWYVSVIL